MSHFFFLSFEIVAYAFLQMRYLWKKKEWEGIDIEFGCLVDSSKSME